jgi:hypothetical protein
MGKATEKIKQWKIKVNTKRQNKGMQGATEEDQQTPLKDTERNTSRLSGKGEL